MSEIGPQQGSLRIDGISKAYVSGDRKGGSALVFDHFSVDVRCGEITAILGPTGCGKSTLLGIIAGIIVADEGSVRYSCGRTRLRFGLMPQRDALFPWRTVRKNARLGLELSGRSRLNGGEVDSLLSRLGLEPYADCYPSELSGGMRQKVSFARTLTLNPEFLLLDEPFASIDFHQRLDLEEYCVSWTRKNTEGAILVTHDVEHAIAMADRVLVLSGKPATIVEDFGVTLGSAERKPLEVRGHREFAGYLQRVREAMR